MNGRVVLSLLLWIPVSTVFCGPRQNQTELAITYPDFIRISVENPLPAERIDEPLKLCVRKIKDKHADFNAEAFVVLSADREIPSQVNDLDGDGQADQVVILTDYAPGEKKILTVRYTKKGVLKRKYKKRTQAELSHKFGGKFIDRKYQDGQFRNVQYLGVPPEHTDHSFFIRYEGPGWESDKVGYRFYLDWRNAVDIFGKKRSDMVLQNVGQDGFDSYHEMADWGMDILKVGESLGIGSVGMWKNGKAVRVSVTDSISCEIVSNGSVQSQIRTRYHGWQVDSAVYDLISDLSITGGCRLTRHSLQINGNPDNLCTGLVKHEDTELIRSENKESKWAYLALYGKQSLAGDNLGMAVLYPAENRIEITEDEHSHVIVLKPKDGRLTYYFGAAWEQEPAGIQSKETFVQYLENMVTRLNAPLKVTL